MHPAVPMHVRNRRKNAVMRLQASICREESLRLVGRTLEVFVEGRLSGEEHVYVGRTYRDAPEIDGLVFVSGDAEAGTIVPVHITGVLGDYDLMGTVSK